MARNEWDLLHPIRAVIDMLWSCHDFLSVGMIVPPVIHPYFSYMCLANHIQHSPFCSPLRVSYARAVTLLAMAGNEWALPHPIRAVIGIVDCPDSSPAYWCSKPQHTTCAPHGQGPSRRYIDSSGSCGWSSDCLRYLCHSYEQHWNDARSQPEP